MGILKKARKRSRDFEVIRGGDIWERYDESDPEHVIEMTKEDCTDIFNAWTTREVYAFEFPLRDLWVRIRTDTTDTVLDVRVMLNEQSGKRFIDYGNIIFSIREEDNACQAAVPIFAEKKGGRIALVPMVYVREEGRRTSDKFFRGRDFRSQGTAFFVVWYYLQNKIADPEYKLVTLRDECDYTPTVIKAEDYSEKIYKFAKERKKEGFDGYFEEERLGFQMINEFEKLTEREKAEVRARFKGL